MVFLSRPLAATVTAAAMRNPYAWVRLCGGQALLVLPLLFRLRWHLLAPLQAAMGALCASQLPATAAAVHAAVPGISAEAFVVACAAFLVTVGLPLPLLACRYVLHVERQRFVTSALRASGGGRPRGRGSMGHGVLHRSQHDVAERHSLADSSVSAGQTACDWPAKQLPLPAVPASAAAMEGKADRAAATLDGGAELPQHPTEASDEPALWRSTSSRGTKYGRSLSAAFDPMASFAMPQPGPALHGNSTVSLAPEGGFAESSVDDLVSQWEAAVFQPPPDPPFSSVVDRSACKPAADALTEAPASAALAVPAAALSDSKSEDSDSLLDHVSLSLEELLTRADALVDELLDDMHQSRSLNQRAPADALQSDSSSDGGGGGSSSGGGQSPDHCTVPTPGSVPPEQPALVSAGMRPSAARFRPALDAATQPPARPFSQQFEESVDALIDEELDGLLAEVGDQRPVAPTRVAPRTDGGAGPPPGRCMSGRGWLTR